METTSKTAVPTAKRESLTQQQAAALEARQNARKAEAAAARFELNKEYESIPTDPTMRVSTITAAFLHLDSQILDLWESISNALDDYFSDEKTACDVMSDVFADSLNDLREQALKFAAKSIESQRDRRYNYHVI